MRKDSYWDGFRHGAILIGFVVLLLGVNFGVCRGRSISDSHWRRTSVIEGKAEYVTTDGKPEWRWKP